MKTIKNQNTVKSKIQILTLLLLFTAGGLKAQKATNFTGTWVRNAEKCDAGDLSKNSIPIQISVKQSSVQVEIKRVSRSVQGDTSIYTEKIKFDGSPAPSFVKTNLNKRSAIKWSQDQKVWTETADYMDGQGNIVQKAQESWSLNDDGKTLTIKLTLTINGQDYLLSEVFDKK